MYVYRCTEHFTFIFQGFFKILIVSIEVYIVQAYYNQQKLYAISNFVRLKWKYLPKTKTQTDQTRTISTTEKHNRTQQDGFGNIPIFVKNLHEIQNPTTS